MVDDVVQAHYGKKTKLFVLMLGNIVSKLSTYNNLSASNFLKNRD